MSWSDSDIAALVEPDRVHRKAYVDPDIFELEMERIFERLWIYVGHESQVKNPGDFYLARIGRQPMMMVRDRRGDIHVLYNRCPHRGARICSARRGNAGDLFRCSYHAWMFELDGRLESVPAENGYAGTRFDRDDPSFRLRPAPRADNYRGFWFASLAADGPDLETHLGGSKTAFDQLVDRAPAGECEVVGDCFRMIQQSNWKIFLENQIDVSHPGATHESTGAAATTVERDFAEAGAEPPMGYAFLSDFKRHGIAGWDKFGTTGHPQGHCTLEGYMGLRPERSRHRRVCAPHVRGLWRGARRGDPRRQPPPRAGLSLQLGAAAAAAAPHHPSARARPHAERDLAIPPQGGQRGDSTGARWPTTTSSTRPRPWSTPTICTTGGSASAASRAAAANGSACTATPARMSSAAASCTRRRSR